jgi:hypothetical protein
VVVVVTLSIGRIHVFSANAVDVRMGPDKFAQFDTEAANPRRRQRVLDTGQVHLDSEVDGPAAAVADVA